MASTQKVAVVTGSNKGIGFAIVRELCKQFKGNVYLTSRDVSRGQEAVKKLNAEGLDPKFHQLDVTDISSIRALRDFLKDKYGGLDVLVNNAGIAFGKDDPKPFAEQAKVLIQTNYYGVLNVCKELFPLLRPHCRVVHISSFTSQMAFKNCSPELQAKFKDPKLTLEELSGLMDEFVRLAQEGKHVAAGYPDFGYGVSKIGVTVLGFIQQRQFDAEKKEDFIVNTCCPGHVDTDLVPSIKGKLTIDQGADTPVMLALISPNSTSPRGEYLTERKIQKWA